MLFDVDGTLVDSTYVHVTAWAQALSEVGHPVPSARIHRGMGMGGGRLLAWLLGDEAAAAIQGEASQRHSELFFAQSATLQALPGARELVAHCVERGHAVVLATSAKSDELDVLLAALRLTVDVAAITHADHVDESKPDPELMHVAMARVNADPSRTVMIGDARWDAESASRAGIKAVGVQSGGLAREELLAAGAVAVYEDPAELLAGFDSSPLAVL